MKRLIILGFLLLALITGVIFAQEDRLTGTQWHLVSYGDDTALIEGSEITLEFGEDNSIGGFGGCNTYGGTYTLQDDTITFSDVFSTRRACADSAVTQQEQAFFRALQSATTYTLLGDQLILEYDDGQQLVFERAGGLAGSQWQLIAYGDEATPIEGSEITLEFTEDQEALGSGGCNSYSSSYEIDGDTLTFGEIVSTKKACTEDNLTQQEQAYYEALQSATRYEIIEGQLIIEYGEGEQLVFAQVNPLAGTQWQLVSYGDTDVIADSVITLDFSAENQAGGSGGCNSYSSTYTLDGEEITFAEVVSTLMACADNAVMEQETAYYQALQTATRYEIADDTLILEYGNGQELVFEPVTTTE